MKQILILVCILVFFSACNSDNYEQYKDSKNSIVDYAIIPLPENIQMKKGQFLVDGDTKIIYTNDSLINEADFLSAMLASASDRRIMIAHDMNKGDHGIYLKLDDKIESEEGYNLEVDYDKIQISAKTPKGIFYGIQSLRMLLPPETEKEAVSDLTIPAVAIKDAPRYPYRGMHLDVGRHMFPVKFIKRYIDIIALHKMNRFHWHLTEDQGWRIEIKKYPKLTSVGSKRKETMVKKNRNPYIGDGKEYGGFYTQEEVKDIVAYAQKKHIVIIPEIEMPGHARAALAAYPELGNGTGPYEVATTWGVFDQVYAPKEKTFDFLEDVLTEVMDLFPSEYIHIGGDEAPKKEWKNSTQAQKVMKQEGLKNENELQSYFIHRIEKFLNKHGRQIIGWDEILQGGLAPNATVMSWRGSKGGVEAAKQGHDVIMTPNTHLYFDYYQTKDTENEPLSWGSFIPVEKVYSLNPTPKELNEKEAKHILGAQGNVWTEYIKTPEHVEYNTLPRMTALAEVNWTQQGQRDWEDFNFRLQQLRRRYDALSYNYAKHVFDDASKNQKEAESVKKNK